MQVLIKGGCFEVSDQAPYVEASVDGFVMPKHRVAIVLSQEQARSMIEILQAFVEPDCCMGYGMMVHDTQVSFMHEQIADASGCHLY